MINALSLQEKLIANPNKIRDVLEALGFVNITFHTNYYAFPNLDGDNKTACNIYISNLHYENWTRNIHGNIFTLVMDIRKCSFVSALDFVSKVTNIHTNNYAKKKLPFNGFFHNLKNINNENEINVPIYTENDLPPKDCLSKFFFDDNIPYVIQEKWGIRYCQYDNSIWIPVEDYYGRIVGAKCRNNDRNCAHNQRYWAGISFCKNLFIYGYYRNYAKIIKRRMVIIVESEKSVLIADGFGCNLCIAIGGHKLSDTQVHYIKALMCDVIIIAFDEGLLEQDIINECIKLKNHNLINKSKIGYIYDNNNVILQKNKKQSPLDVGKKNFEILVKKYTKYLGE